MCLHNLAELKFRLEESKKYAAKLSQWNSHFSLATEKHITHFPIHHILAVLMASTKLFIDTYFAWRAWIIPILLFLILRHLRHGGHWILLSPTYCICSTSPIVSWCIITCIHTRHQGGGGRKSEGVDVNDRLGERKCVSSVGTQKDLSQGTKRIAQGLRLFYQRHLAQVTITCSPAATAATCIYAHILWTLGSDWSTAVASPF